MLLTFCSLQMVSHPSGQLQHPPAQVQMGEGGDYECFFMTTVCFTLTVCTVAVQYCSCRSFSCVKPMVMGH